MKRFFAFLLPLLIMAGACTSRNGEYTLTVLATNDVHGSWFDTPYVGEGVRPSLMAVNTYVDSIRSAVGKDNVLLIDSGDCLQGNNAAYYFNYVDTADTHLYPRIASYMGYDAVTVGNHDIETGPKVYDRVEEQLRKEGIPFLAGNALKSDGKTYFPEYKIFNRGGMKVLVLGFTNPNMQAWLDKSLWPDMEFVSLIPLVQNRVDALRAKFNPDITVVSVHSGSGNGDGTILEAQGLDLYKSLKDVDLLLCSHDHSPLVINGDGISLVNTGSRAAHLGEARVTLTYSKGKVVSRKVSAHLFNVDPRKVDVRMKEHFADDFNKVKAFTVKPVGKLLQAVYTRDAFGGQSFYMDLIHKVQLIGSGADVSFSAPLTFNGVLKEGELVFNDMFTLYPYENSLCVVNLTGRMIKDYLEYSYDGWIGGSDGHVLNIVKRESERYGTTRWSFVRPSFNFDSAAGINYTVDVTKPYGRRVFIESMADGSGFDLNKTYKVAMTSYRAAGGGDLLFKGAGLTRDELESRIIARYPAIRDMVYDYIREQKTISTSSTAGVGKWRFVPSGYADRAISKDVNLLFDKQ